MSRSRTSGTGARTASGRRKARTTGEGKADGSARNGRSTQTVASAVPEKEFSVAGAGGTRIVWDTSKMRSVYANVCSVSSTREEVVMLFGLNQTWNRLQDIVSVKLSDRIVLSPTAGKRMALALRSVIEEYEKRWGPLDV